MIPRIRSSRSNDRGTEVVTLLRLFLFSVSPCLRGEQVLQSFPQSPLLVNTDRVCVLRFRRRDARSLLPAAARLTAVPAGRRAASQSGVRANLRFSFLVEDLSAQGTARN